MYIRIIFNQYQLLLQIVGNIGIGKKIENAISTMTMKKKNVVL